MDADALSLLIILRQELKEIANNLQPQLEIIEDIMTDNGLIENDPNNNDNNLSLTPPPNNEHDNEEDEKAPELKEQITKAPPKKINYNNIGFKIDDLIQNYLTPTIKQLNKKPKKNSKKKRKSDINNYYSPHKQSDNPMMETRLSSPPLMHNSQSEPAPMSYLHNDSVPKNIINNNNGLFQPGQVIDDMSNYSEKLGSCCRKFVTSLFCGCGVFQCIVIFIVFMMFGLMFVFYNASEITMILKELNYWQELSVKRVEYELTNKEKLAQINFDMDVDIDKLKEEHKHREHMEIIEAKKLLTKDFIDKNTRTVTTTYWNFLTTETETVSQTIFSEEDIAFFQNNILYYGFNSDNAIESPEDIKKKADKQIDGGVSENDTSIDDNDTTQCTSSDSELCSTSDDFDSI